MLRVLTATFVPVKQSQKRTVSPPSGRIFDGQAKYELKASTLLSDEQIEQLARGVELDDGPSRPALVRRLRDHPRYAHLELTITEGRNRQVRRMVEAVGSKVLKLVRTAIGPIRIGDLPIGKWQPLTADEVKSLGG